jgi:hypothetical protein
MGARLVVLLLSVLPAFRARLYLFIRCFPSSSGGSVPLRVISPKTAEKFYLDVHQFGNLYMELVCLAACF